MMNICFFTNINPYYILFCFVNSKCSFVWTGFIFTFGRNSFKIEYSFAIRLIAPLVELNGNWGNWQTKQGKLKPSQMSFRFGKEAF